MGYDMTKIMKIRNVGDYSRYLGYVEQHPLVFKKMTGDTASDHIRKYVIQLAKNALAGGTPIAQVAYELGVEYSQHFSRMFKKQTGVTPSTYCEELRKRQ